VDTGLSISAARFRSFDHRCGHRYEYDPQLSCMTKHRRVTVSESRLNFALEIIIIIIIQHLYSAIMSYADTEALTNTKNWGFLRTFANKSTVSYVTDG